MNKGFLLLGGLGVSGATATGVALNREKIFGTKKVHSISDLLNKEHRILIADEESSHWDSKWKEYLASGDNLWNIAEWKSGTEPTTIPSSFKNKCSNISGEKVSGIKDSIYKEVVRYCARDKSMADRFKEDGVELLSKTGKDNEWNDVFDKYKAEANSLKIKGIDINPTDDKGTNNNLDKIKNGCHDVAAKPIKDTSYSYEAIKKWCTVARAATR